jgi:hypothetical protein
VEQSLGAQSDFSDLQHNPPVLTIAGQSGNGGEYVELSNFSLLKILR